MKHKLFTLSNNLPVITVDTKTFPSVTVLLLVGAGSRYEQKENNGIAHFFEHMAFKGSKKYPDSFSISSTIDSMGARNNAFTGKDYTGYYIKGSVDSLDKMLDVLSDMIQNPILDEKEIEKEKGVVKEEISTYEDMPHRHVIDLYETMLYKDSSLGFEIAGTKKTVNSFTREMILDYIDSWYSPSNSVLILSGGLTKIEGLEDRVSRHFNKWNGRKIENRYEIIKNGSFYPQIEEHNKKTEQIHVCVGYRTFGRNDKRRYALSILSAILGSGMSSRLFNELREKRGLCYYVSTYADLYEETGHLTTRAGIRSDRSSYEQAIALIKDEHEKIKTKGLYRGELDRVKSMIKGNTILSLESSSYIAAGYGMNYIYYGKVISPEKELENIEKVTENDVVEVAKEIVEENRLNICAIGVHND